MQKISHKQLKKGSILVEAIVGVTLFLLIVLALSQAFVLSLKASLSNTDNVQGAYLSEEGLEAARIWRDATWTGNIASLTSGTSYYFAWNGTTWTATSTNIFIDGLFERKIVFSDVYRNGSQDIVQSGGSLDSNTRKAVVSVSWRAASATTTRSLSTYLTNVYKN